MDSVYRVIDAIKTELINTELIKTVTFGDVSKIANYKKTQFALGHITLNTSTIEPNIVRFNLSVFAMDIIDVNKSDTTDVFIGNDNLQNILQDMHSALHRVVQLLRNGTLWDNNIELGTDPTMESFTDRFEDVVAGWVIDLDIIIPNEMSVC